MKGKQKQGAHSNLVSYRSAKTQSPESFSFGQSSQPIWFSLRSWEQPWYEDLRVVEIDCNNKAWFLEGHENKNNIYMTMPGVLYSPWTRP